MAGMLIGELARRTGVKAQTIRYYEQLSLLTPATRSAAGYRRYDERSVDELSFIRKAQTLGFSLDEIGEILQLGRAGKAPCNRVLRLAQEHVTDLTSRIEQLQRSHIQLSAAIREWQAGGVPQECARTFCGLITNAIVEAHSNRSTPRGVTPGNWRAAARDVRSHRVGT